MKLALILLTAAASFAAPIYFTAAGSVSPITDGWFITTENLPGTAHDRFAVFTASEPLLSISFYADNLPHSIGSGWIFYLDGIEVLNTGIGNLVQATLQFVAVQPFTAIRVETNYAPGLLERGDVTHFVGTPAAVPEPATWVLLGVGLLVLGVVLGLRKIRSMPRMKP